MKTNTIIILIILVLAALNVYQFRNPQVIEVPGEQTAIDSTAWEQQSAYADRGVLLDSIKAENEKLAKRIRKSRDDIANLTNINGRLNLQVDSLETVNRLPLAFENLPESGRTWQSSDSTAAELFQESEKHGYSTRFLADTSYNFIGVFGEGLFRVDSEVWFNDTAIRNNLNLTQLRDIRISVVNTMNKDRSRMLTYVTSQDFEKLEYQTYTELKRRKRWPWFLIGVGVGVTGLAIVD